jgi:hypothetical protein
MAQSCAADARDQRVLINQSNNNNQGIKMTLTIKHTTGDTTQSDSLASPVSVRSGSGVIRVTNGDISTVSEGSAHVQMAHTSNGAKGILSTLQAPGSGVAKAVSTAKPTDRITIGGIEMTVANAERQGLLHRNDAGALVETTAQELAAAQKDRDAAHEAEQPAEDQPLPQALLPEAENMLQHMTEHAGNVNVAKVFNDIATNGVVTQGTLNQAATALAIEPSQLSGALQNLQGHFQKQAEASIASRHGDLNMADLWEFANSDPEGRQLLNKAANDHFKSRHTRSYDPLVRRYLEAAGTRNPDGVIANATAQGVKAYKDQRGNVVVELPGKPPTTWDNAVRLGWIGGGRKR